MLTLFSGATTYNLDSLGDSITTATLLSWQKSVGSQVKEDDVVAVVETDKVRFNVVPPCIVGKGLYLLGHHGHSSQGLRYTCRANGQRRG
jgi:hypothetical protein